jgi:hypothetical protein
LKKHLREVWTGIFLFYSIYLLAQPAIMETVMTLHRKFPNWQGYALTGTLGALVLCGYWWLTGFMFTSQPKAAIKPDTAHLQEATPSSTTQEHQSQSLQHLPDAAKVTTSRSTAEPKISHGVSTVVSVSTVSTPITPPRQGARLTALPWTSTKDDINRQLNLIAPFQNVGDVATVALITFSVEIDGTKMDEGQPSTIDLVINGSRSKSFSIALEDKYDDVIATRKMLEVIMDAAYKTGIDDQRLQFHQVIRLLKDVKLGIIDENTINIP